MPGGRPRARIPRRSALLGICGIAGFALVPLVPLAALEGCARPGKASGSPRVISISPSTTEAAFAIGAGDLLVGRSKYCDYPPDAARLPAVGGYADPSIEAIIALAPTLVIGARGPAGPVLEQTLRSHGIETFFPETESIAQIESMLEELGRKLGRVEGATAAVARIRERKDAVAKAVAGRKPVRAVLLFDLAPIVVAGPGSFPDELIRLAGGQNVIERGGAYPTINIEHLLALDPDLIIDAMSMAIDGVAAAPLRAQRDAPGWRELRAVKEGHLRAIDSANALRPGPRIGDGLATLARALHGDALARLP